MSFQDPRYDTRMPQNRYDEDVDVRGVNRAWIGGALVVLLLLGVLLLTFSGKNERVASQQAPATATQTMPRTIPSAPPAAPARTPAPAENTGSR